MNNGWTTSQLVSLVSGVTSGATPQSGNARYYADEVGYPFAKIDDLTACPGSSLDDTALHVRPVALRETALKLYPAGTILLSMYGTVGLVKVASREVTANQALAALLPPFACDARFLYHLLTWERPGWDRFKSQTTQANINGRIVKTREFAIPPEDEQQRIAQVLDTLDEQVAFTEALIAKQERVRDGLQLDLLLGAQVAGPRVRSSLGPVPRDWEIRKIDELSSHVGSGITPRGGSDVYLDEGVLFIRSQNVHFDGLHLDDVAYISDRVNTSMLRSQLLPWDVLLNITGASIGRCCVLPEGLGPANVNQHVCAIRLIEPTNADAIFLAAFLRSPLGQRQVRVLNAGGNREGLNYQQIRAFDVVWPPRHDRERTAMVLSEADDGIRCATDELAKLTSLRAALRSDLLTGRVRTQAGGAK